MEIDAPDVTVVARCQVAPALGDPAANRDLAADAVSRAAAQGAAVVVLPELVSSGYVFESRAEAKASAEEADGEEFPEWVRLPALDGAQLLCAPANWPAFPRPDGERPAEIVRVQADAAVNRMFIAACDRTGEERGVAWVEGSVIVDADGWPLACAAPAGGPVIITAECRLGSALDKAIGPRNDVHADRRPGLYQRVAAEPL